MPLDTTVRHYTSLMNAAPSMTSAANSLIQVLDAVLVNGFGSQTVTSIVVTNNVATVTVNTGYVVPKFAVVNISGATPNELNGDKKVLSTDNSISFTYDATGVANQTATGTITVKFPGAGWTRPFANTLANVAVYRNSTSGTGFYLRVVDSTLYYARGIAYETMTDENTGTNLCPTTTQISGGLYINKSNNATAKKWWIIADSKTFYLAGALNSTIPDGIKFHTAIGDFKKYVLNDNYNFMFISRDGDGTGFGGTIYGSSIVVAGANYTGIAAQKSVMRSYTQVPGAKPFSMNYLFDDLTSYSSGNSGGLAFPQVPKFTTHFSPSYIIESNMIRGEQRGIYCTGQNLRPDNYDYINDDIIFKDGKYYIYKAFEIGATAGSWGIDQACFVDVTGPWE